MPVAYEWYCKSGNSLRASNLCIFVWGILVQPNVTTWDLYMLMCACSHELNHITSCRNHLSTKPHDFNFLIYHTCVAGFLWCTHAQHSCTTAAGADYVAVAGEELVFSRGDTRVCHTIDILQDIICEDDPNENFFSDLSYVSGVPPITINPPTAQIVIDDSDELECKYEKISLLTLCVNFVAVSFECIALFMLTWTMHSLRSWIIHNYMHEFRYFIGHSVKHQL